MERSQLQSIADQLSYELKLLGETARVFVTAGGAGRGNAVIAGAYYQLKVEPSSDAFGADATLICSDSWEFKVRDVTLDNTHWAAKQLVTAGRAFAHRIAV